MMKQIETRSRLLVLSGGMDSVTMLYDYVEQIGLAVSFQYGANHNARELHYAALHCERLGVRHRMIDMGFLQHCLKSSLLSGAAAVPEGDYDEENMKSTVVPFRNGIMLAVAAGIANSEGLSGVMIANHGGDHAIYPDCRPEFVEAMGGAIRTGTDGEVSLYAPYTRLTKADIARRGTALGVDYALTWSCYKGGEVHCGVCGTCRERKAAFREAGLVDPTRYAQ